MSAAARRLPAALVALLAGALSSLGAAPAMAYWNGNGTGSGQALVTTLQPPTLSLEAAAESVRLSWSAALAPEAGTPVSYYVRRNGGAPSSGCPSEAAPSTALSCIDTGLAPGASYSYSVVAVWRSWRAESEARSITLATDEATRLLLTPARAEVRAGEADALTLTAVDAAGHTVSSYSGTHSVVFSGASASPSGQAPTVSGQNATAYKLGEATPIEFTAGVATVQGAGNGQLSLYRAEEAKIVASAGLISSASAPAAIRVLAGPFSDFGVSPVGAPPQAGVEFSLRISAQDAWGNVLSNYIPTGPLSYSGAAPSPAPAAKAPEYSTQLRPAFSSGEATVAGFRLYDAASTTLTVTEAGTANTGSATFMVQPGAPASLQLSAQTNRVLAGEGDALSISALDSWDNVASSFGGAAGEIKNILFSGAQPGRNGLAPTVSAQNGQPSAFGTPTALEFIAGHATVAGTANGLMTLYRAEVAQIQASEPTLALLSPAVAVTVAPGAARSFAVSAPTPAEVLAGGAFSLSLTALDAGGNVATSFGGPGGESKALSFAGGESSPSGKAPLYPASATTVSFREGLGSASGITLYRAGASTLTVSSGAINGSVAFTVLPGEAKRLAWSEVAVSAGTLAEGCALSCLVEGLGSEGIFSARVALSDEWGNPQSTHARAIEVSLLARRQRGFYGGWLSSSEVRIAPGSALSEPFSFHAPRLKVTRRGRPGSYQYLLRAVASGYTRQHSARATLKS